MTAAPAGEARARLRDDLALAACCLLAFLILATGSYLNPGRALAVCAGAVGLAALLDARAIWVLALGLIPFARIFAFPPTYMQALVSIALVAAALRCLPAILLELRALPSSRSWYAWILLAFAALVAAHFTSLSAMAVAGAGLLAAMIALFLMARRIPQHAPRYLALTECAMTGSTLAAAALSAAYDYIPWPHLVINCPLPDSLRLTGVFDGPNAAARYLLPVFGFFLARSLLDRPRQGRWLAGLSVAALFLAATETKAAIGAALLMCLLAAALVPRALWRRAAVLLAATVLCLLLWMVKLGMVVDHHAATRWWALGNKGVSGFALENADDLSLLAMLKQELRIGMSTEVVYKPGTRIVSRITTSSSLWHTGQRDLVWRAGLETVRDHPWWGIGYKTWQEEMMQRLGFPFRGPHNGFLEVAGAYGALGGALYVLLAAALARNLLAVRRRLHTSPANPRLLWVTLSAAAFFAVELVDVSTSLAVTLCAVWFWVFLGLQEGLLRQPPAAG